MYDSYVLFHMLVSWTVVYALSTVIISCQLLAQWAAVGREQLSVLIHPSLSALTQVWWEEDPQKKPHRLRAIINLIPTQLIWHTSSIGAGSTYVVLKKSHITHRAKHLHWNPWSFSLNYITSLPPCFPPNLIHPSDGFEHQSRGHMTWMGNQ